MSVNDESYKRLGEAGYTGSFNDRTLKALQFAVGTTEGNVQDLWIKLFDRDSIDPGAFNDRMLKYLQTSLGASSSNLNDAMLEVALSSSIVNDNSILRMPLIEDLSMPIGTGSATFTRSTTGTYIDKDDGLLKTAAINAARFESAGVLLEDASTNLVLRSEAFNSVSWTKGGGSIVTPNVATDPMGTTLADKVTISTGGLGEQVNQSVFYTDSGQAVVFSIYIKDFDTGAVNIRVLLSGGTSIDAYADFDFISKSFSGVSSGVDSVAFSELDDGWYRVELISFGNSSNNVVRYGVGGSAGAAATGDFYVWGAQLEELTFASSYIPTTTAAVTRTADVLSIPSANLPKWNEASSIAFSYDFLSATDPGFTQGLFGVVGETYRYIRHTTGGAVTSAWVNGINITGAYESSGSLAITNDGAETEAYFDAVTANTGTVGSDPGTATALNIGNVAHVTQRMYGHIKDLRVFDAELTAARVSML